MRIQLNRLAGAALVAALGFTMAACNDDDSSGGGGDGDGGKKSAGAPSAEEFCELATSLEDSDIADDDYDAQEEALHDYADDMLDLGTPEDMPEDAKHGFEVVMKAYGEVDSDDLADENFSDELEEKYKDDEDDIEAYFTYQGETCSDTGSSSDAPSASVPTEAPSSFSTDLPSGVPSDLPTDPEELESLLSDIPTSLYTQ